ncbi:hypothetical protein VCV18_012755 [Metarhizium anisopliae]
MYTNGDNEALARVGKEAERAAGTAVAYGEDVRVIGFAPGAVSKDGFFHKVEKCLRIGLVDLCGDGVGYSVQVPTLGSVYMGDEEW